MNGHGVSQSYYNEQVARNAALKEEIERLRAELAAMYAKHPENACYDVPTWDKLRAELSAAKALLREADAELTSWMYHGHGSKDSGFGSAPLLNRIRAALSDKPAPTNASEKP